MSDEDTVEKDKKELVKAKQKDIEKKDDKNKDKIRENKNEEEKIIAKTEIDYSTLSIKPIETDSIKVEKYKPIAKTNIAKLELKDTISIPIKLETKIQSNINKKSVDASVDSNPIPTYTNLSTSVTIPRVMINKPRPLIKDVKAELPDIKPLSVSNELSIPRHTIQSKISIKPIIADTPKINIMQKEITIPKVQDARSIDSDPNDDEILKVLDEFELKIKGFSEAVTTSPPNRPICLILPKRDDESYVYSVALICRELYRIVKGGKAEPRWLSEGKEEIEESMKAGNRIFVIDDAKSELLPQFDKITNASDLDRKVKESKLLDRLKELFSQDYGFIIFHIKDKWINEFARLLEQGGYHIPKIIKLEPKFILDDEKRSLAKVCWEFVEGFVDTDTHGFTFDEIFGNAEKNYYKLLEDKSKDIELKHYIKGDENAGFEHEVLKLIAIKALTKELGAKNKEDVIEYLKQGKIKTEYEFNNFRADIFIPEQNRYIEIETLYGTEDPISKKLDKETLSKYKNMNVNNIDIVLLGLHLLLYAKYLYELKKIYKEEHNIKVNFYTIDVKNERLVPIKEIKEILSSFMV